ncbi:class I SAM-dependent methyltransferase [Brevundimonas sp. SL130]|uniref:class I SAM-dependent methyltransferase n=1 Tax=Brevundimonas sp. SL130 TaxID=2995143 RepID=UPI00226CCDCF|nr:class I SAM-dependent methyltransferase [Brevundimonas sp. SL130]WAC60326.1 class I SAM-dependent methyltransferase [Brevundimonas sp. SL130]
MFGFSKTKTAASASRKEATHAKLEAEVLRLQAELAQRDQQPHFVSDYTAYVRDLMQKHPLDEAMAYAVGGAYDQTGFLLVEVLERCGLKENMSVVDLGCGSGRLAKHLGLKYPNIQYLGIDIVQELLDYAQSQSPDHFHFVLNHTLKLPADDGSADMVAIFSVITHLLHQESFAYLKEARRVLRPGGRIVFSFLESENNWSIFQGMVDRAESGVKDDQLNMITERPQIEAWAQRLDMDVVSYDLGLPHQGDGQTVVVFADRRAD